MQQRTLVVNQRNSKTGKKPLDSRFKIRFSPITYKMRFWLIIERRRGWRRYVHNDVGKILTTICIQVSRSQSSRWQEDGRGRKEERDRKTDQTDITRARHIETTFHTMERVTLVPSRARLGDRKRWKEQAPRNWQSWWQKLARLDDWILWISNSNVVL